jgi:hypothetical protein
MSFRTIIDISLQPVYASEARREEEIAILYALLPLMSPLWSEPRDRADAHGEATGASASQLLVVVATALFVILSILPVDLHRDELDALGLVGGAEPINAVFMSP